MIHISSKVYTTVSVLGERVRMAQGSVVGQSFDRCNSEVDIMSLHGGRPWVILHATRDLDLVEDGGEREQRRDRR